jgi:hypothetical protein
VGRKKRNKNQARGLLFVHARGRDESVGGSR